MARRVAIVKITAEGRDQGKSFVITEMSATRAEKWADRVLLALGQSGVEIPDNLAQAGAAGLALISVRAFVSIPWHLAEPLLDEMFACVQIQPDPRHPEVVRALIEDDIEEVATRLKLREEVLSLHLGFSLAEHISKIQAALTATDGATSSIATSPASSAP